MAEKSDKADTSRQVAAAPPIPETTPDNLAGSIATVTTYDNSLLPSDTTEKLVREAPDVSDGAKKVYRVLYPVDRYVVPGLPVITREGIALTADQEKTLLEAVDADSGVKVVTE